MSNMEFKLEMIYQMLFMLLNDEQKEKIKNKELEHINGELIIAKSKYESFKNKLKDENGVDK